MSKQYYQKELSRLREDAVEFAKAHPALAPMLTGPSKDPDVERLLEGTAYLAGMLRQKLEDEFPEVIHGLTRLVLPHYLRPVPSATMIEFTPKQGLTESRLIPAGVQLASVPVDGTTCLFRTCQDVEVHPLRLTGAKLLDQPGAFGQVVLNFALIERQLSDWRPASLRFHLAGDFSQASSIWALLIRYTRRILVTDERQQIVFELGKDSLRPSGLDTRQGLLPQPSHAFRAFSSLQELFVIPERFLFIDVNGLDGWRQPTEGTTFSLVFELDSVPDWTPPIKTNSFVLYASPAINLFQHDAEPITVDHTLTEYQVLCAQGAEENYQIYSIEEVTGYTAGSVQRRNYSPFEYFRKAGGGRFQFATRQKHSALGTRINHFLSLIYPPNEELPQRETLSIKLLCTNSHLPERLQYGDIHRPTSTSPNQCDFRNIIPPRPQFLPPIGSELLWRLLSHVSLNLLSLAEAENLRTLLRLYLFPHNKNRSAIIANERRIDSIVKLTCETDNRLVDGIPMRGQRVDLHLRQTHFASTGDLVLFSAVLDSFFGAYASINSYCHLRVLDPDTGERFEWPPRIGDRPLL